MAGILPTLASNDEYPRTCMKIERTIGMAVIGTGFMGTLYARICAQMPGVSVVAVCDLLPERVVPLAEELGAVAYPAADYNRMFKEQDQIDAVLVCTREDSHREPALAALEVGKHLMVEKPLATSVNDAMAIVDAARCRGHLITMMAHTLRFDPRYQRLQHAIEQNEIGELIHLYARRTPPYAALERIGGRVELPFWVGVHDIDMMRWITGSEVSRVLAVSSEKGLKERSVKSAVISLLTFENGVIATLENSWGPVSSAAGQQSTAFFRAQGTRGIVEVKNLNQGVKIERDGSVAFPDTVYISDSYGRITGAYTDQISYFVNCIRLEKTSSVQLQDGLQSVAVAEAILRSSNCASDVIRSI
jgi:predicted dehydrogenase